MAVKLTGSYITNLQTITLFTNQKKYGQKFTLYNFGIVTISPIFSFPPLVFYNTYFLTKIPQLFYFISQNSFVNLRKKF